MQRCATLQRCVTACVSRSQAEMRPEWPKMEAAGQYYGKNQADRLRFLMLIMRPFGFLSAGLFCTGF